MIDFSQYNLSNDDIEFLEYLREELEISQAPVDLKCGDYSFHIDPGSGGAQIWRYGEMIGDFKTIDDLFLNFKIDGKSFIERISEIEYD